MKKFLSYIKFIKNKINKVNQYVDNPINATKYESNPFCFYCNHTYVWIEKDEGE